MRKFETDNFRERDAEDRLSAAGLSWVEARFGVQLAGSVLFWLGAYLFVVLGIGILATDAKAGFTKATLAAALLAAGAIWMLHLWGSRERAVVFRPDRIELPHGQPRRPDAPQLSIAITDVANIEVWRGGDECWVLLYTRGADAHVLGRGLNEFQARKVVALLSGARDDLRESLAQRRSGQPSVRRIIN